MLASTYIEICNYAQNGKAERELTKSEQALYDELRAAVEKAEAEGKTVEFASPFGICEEDFANVDTKKFYPDDYRENLLKKIGGK